MEIKISDELNAIINFAREEAMRTGSYGISPDHLFLGILRHGNNVACEIIRALDTDLEELKSHIDRHVFTNEHIPFSEIDHVTFSRGSQNILSITILEATRLNCSEASSQHLLLALLRNTGSYGQGYLRDAGIDYGRVITYMADNGLIGREDNDGNDGNEGEPADEDNAKPQENRQSLLETFGTDLTKAAAEDRLDPVVGREEEMARVVEILCRRKKNNPMLVGPAGAGKSAVVEGIAARIAAGDIPADMAGKRIISLDMASVVAGTKFRGDFEKRIKSIIGELKNSPDIILFIDEFHTVVGAGGTSGSLDAANMLKPALARGEIRCIGATTYDEFKKIIEKDGALDRRFQKVAVEPTDKVRTKMILAGLKEKYENFHKVVYTSEAIEACVDLSDRYIADRCLPDKAIDAMDEAGAKVKLAAGKKAGRNSSGRRDGEIPQVTAEDIAAIISSATGIPAGRVAESEGHRLLKMKDRLRNRIIGQDDAIEIVTRAIIRNRSGIMSPDRPVGTFLFCGPTGVGKTQLAKSLAELLFDSPENFIRIDMSEYMEKFSVSRLTGAPPGYVGYDEGGQLSEKVRRKPYSVVLLDEIEKAHPDIFNLLLQILDEGRLTDSSGRTVSFRNTILVMTSNVGSRDIDEFGRSIGFTQSEAGTRAHIGTLLDKAIRRVFPPEFVNRIDEIVHFNPLTKADIDKIIDIEIRDLGKRVSAEGYRLNVTAAAKRLVSAAGFDRKFGARPLKRAVRKYIEDPVSEIIISERAAGITGNGSDIIRIGMSSDRTGTSATVIFSASGESDVNDLKVHVLDHAGK